MIDDAIGSYRARADASVHRPELSVSYGAPAGFVSRNDGTALLRAGEDLLQRAASLQGADQVAPYAIEAREAGRIV